MTMDVVEKELGTDASGPFFLGKDVSLVDCVFAPFLERIVASIAYYKGARQGPSANIGVPLCLLHLPSLVEDGQSRSCPCKAQADLKLDNA